MDVRARHILGILRDYKETSEAILAGGAVRDDFFGIQPKDYDFFVPYSPSLVTFLTETLKSVPKKADKRYQYSKDLPIHQVYNWNFDGIDVQVMLTKFANDEEFADSVMDSFDFGINKIYYDNSIILRDTEEFQKDFNQSTMTLYGLTDLKYLPKYLDRYQKINAKLGGNFHFVCPDLELKPSTRKKRKFVELKKEVNRLTDNTTATASYQRYLAGNGDWARDQLEAVGRFLRPVGNRLVVNERDDIAENAAAEIPERLMGGPIGGGMGNPAVVPLEQWIDRVVEVNNDVLNAVRDINNGDMRNVRPVGAPIGNRAGERIPLAQWIDELPEFENRN